MEQTNKERALAEYQKRKKKDNLSYALLCIAGVAGFLLIWQLAVQYKWINVRNLPSVAEVFRAVIFKIGNASPDGNVLAVNIKASLEVALSGYALAILIGVPLGLLMGWYEITDRLVRPIFEIIRPIPPIAWIPMIILWAGIGIRAKAIIIFMSAFVPCVINSYLGAKSTNETLINVSKTFGARKFYTFIHVAVPSSVPMILTGVRVALNNAWTCLVAAELLASSAGLGYMITMGRSFGRADIVVTGMVVIGAIGALMSGILSIVEKKMLSWKNSK